MRSIKLAMLLDGDHLIRTDLDCHYRHGEVIAVKLKWFSNKMTLFDYETGKKIISLYRFNPDANRYQWMDIDSFKKVRGSIIGLAKDY